MTTGPERPGADNRVSVVVPAHNAAAHLDRCLAAILSQDPPPAEVIVVDDGSTDETGEIARRAGTVVLRLEGNGGPSRARNRGVERAEGGIILFVDSDVAIHPGTVGRVARLLAGRPETAAVFGSYDDRPAAPGLVSAYRNLLHHYVHQQGDSRAATFWAGLGAVRREVFQELGGFDELAFPRCIEDIEFGYRLKETGYGVFLDKDLTGTHLKGWTLRSVIRTDILCRALPWARLSLARPKVRPGLNLKADQKIAAALLGLALILLAGAWWRPGLAWPGLVSLAGVVTINRGLYLFFLRKGGAALALGGVALHLLYLLYSALSYLAVLASSRLGFSIRDGNTTSP